MFLVRLFVCKLDGKIGSV